MRRAWRTASRRGGVRRAGEAAAVVAIGAALSLAGAVGGGCGGATHHVAASPAPAASSGVPMSALVTFEQLGGDLEGLLAADSDLAFQAGAGQLQMLGSGAAAEGDRIGGFVTFDPNACLLALARGTSRVEDLDILAFDDAGTSLVADQSVGPKATVMVCPPHPARVYLAARVASGSGMVAVGVQQVSKENSAAVASKLGARMSGLADEAVMRAAWSGLDAKVDAHRRALGGRWEELRRVSVPLSQRAASYLSLPLSANRCLDLYVLPNEEVRSVDVTVSDESGREIARAEAVGDDRFALVCTPVDVTLSIGMRPHQGFGLAAVILSRSAPGAETELSVRPETRRVAAMDSLAQVRARLADALSPLPYDKAKTLASATVDTGRTLSYPVSLAAGCSRIDLLVGAPTVGVRGWLWGSHDEIAASAAGGERATMFACVPSAGTWTLDLEGVGRPGAMAAELRKEKSAPAELPKNPVAAGRLLATAAGGRTRFDLRTLTDVKELGLAEDQRTTLDVTVPPRTCRDVVLGLGPGASGVTVRLVDAKSGEELGTAAGAHAASVRACADDNARAFKAYVTLDAGKCAALVAQVPAEGP